MNYCERMFLLEPSKGRKILVKDISPILDKKVQAKTQSVVCFLLCRLPHRNLQLNFQNCQTKEKNSGSFRNLRASAAREFLSRWKIKLEL